LSGFITSIIKCSHFNVRVDDSAQTLSNTTGTVYSSVQAHDGDEAQLKVLMEHFRQSKSKPLAHRDHLALATELVNLLRSLLPALEVVGRENYSAIGRTERSD